MVLTKKNTVLYYPTGIVHFRNLEVLKKILPEFRFIVIIEPWVTRNAPEILEKIAIEDRAELSNGILPNSILEASHLLFLSMAYPNLFRLSLVTQASEKNIPIIAIEEVNQLALNDGIINHYFLPIDYLGVPSSIEKDRFLELGVQNETLTITGWPFFNESQSNANTANTTQNNPEPNIRNLYQIQPHEKICLLILGSLKEHDIVSLETQNVRHTIIETVTNGLPGDYRLLIKPHPVETPSGLASIKKLTPKAILIDPKLPIEPLLAQSDLITNRGNSQVILLAMLQKKPVIIIPAGLTSIFHNSGKSLIATNSADFRNILENYPKNSPFLFDQILKTHFPLSQNEAQSKTRELFYTALQNGPIKDNKKILISLLYAFLGDSGQAENVAYQLPAHQESIADLLIQLYHNQISVKEFSQLLTQFPQVIIRRHLQALWIKNAFTFGDKEQLSEAVSLVSDFDGSVNPHYFIDSIIQRIELEYRAGNTHNAETLIFRFYNDYSVFDFYKQAMDMLQFVYKSGEHRFLWKFLWLLTNLNKPFTRYYIKKLLFTRS